MLLKFYGLDDQPFGVTPDPRFLYFTAGHREALAALYYAIEERRGFSALVAKPGMGKTTLLFASGLDENCVLIPDGSRFKGISRQPCSRLGDYRSNERSAVTP
jgi:type II secretory pathway predicted ATPase ExeA